MNLEAVQFATRIYKYVIDLFVQLMDATGLMPFYLSMLAILLAVTYLLSPFLMSAGSDSVRGDTSKYDHKRYGQNSKNSESKNTRRTGKF